MKPRSERPASNGTMLVVKSCIAGAEPAWLQSGMSYWSLDEENYWTISMVEPRVAVGDAAVLEDRNGHHYQCTILGISDREFRLRLPESIVGPAMRLLRAGNEVHDVEIRWVSLEEAGGIFCN